MSDILNDAEIVRLGQLGKEIKSCLDCDINNTGIPCHTDRLEGVKLMKEYLEIHDHKVTKL